jgi:hypothetical protein
MLIAATTSKSTSNSSASSSTSSNQKNNNSIAARNSSSSVKGNNLGNVRKSLKKTSISTRSNLKNLPNTSKLDSGKSAKS